MIKNFFAFIGFAVITIFIVASVSALGLFYDSLGLVTLPKELPGLSKLAELAPRVGEVTVSAQDGSAGKVTWTNPLDLLPAASPTLPPTPTPYPTVVPTPVPPMEPALYRAQTMASLRQLAADLELWMEANNRMAHDASLLQQPDWRAQVQQALDSSAASAWTLANIGPPPPEYSAIDGMLDMIYNEVEGLRANYIQGATTGSAASFEAAGQSFGRLSDYLTQTAGMMAQSGWAVE